MSFDRCEFELLGCSDLDPMSFYSSIFDSMSNSIPEDVGILSLKDPSSLGAEIDEILNNLDADCESGKSQSDKSTKLEVIIDEGNGSELLGSEVSNTVYDLDFVGSDQSTSFTNFSTDVDSSLDTTLPRTCEPCRLSFSDSDDSPLSLIKDAGFLVLPLTPPDNKSIDVRADLVQCSSKGEEKAQTQTPQQDLVQKKDRICYIDDSSPESHDELSGRLRRLKRKHQDEEYLHETEASFLPSTGLRSIPKRFKSSGFITLETSATQCLEVDLNYHSYTGNITEIILNNNLTNFAFEKHEYTERQSQVVEHITRHYQEKPEEIQIGSHEGPICFESGVLQRKIYVRDISEITDMVSGIIYETSSKFNENIPYEPQYFRYELDEYNHIVGESKCGMCAFCPQIRFFPYKNSSYLSHMILMHGVFANNFVVPEGLYVGRYKLNRTSYRRKKNVIEAIQCPVCFLIIPIRCWKTKTNPLLSYFRHFKKLHQKITRSFIDSVINPVHYNPSA